MDFLIQAKDVVKDFQGHKALDKVSIDVPKGSIYGLLGPNGAGKTTLIRIINQITAPDSGTVSFNGRPLKRDDIYNIGYLPEERGLYKKMKVGEQALYLAQLKGLSQAEAMKKLKEWFEKLEITAWWNKKVEELSKGMAQKVQFITTVLHEPELLIFDEPFSGFDPINVNILKQEILKLRDEGATIIFSTHNMASVEELCDNITLINKSKVVLNGNVEEVKNEYKSNIYRIGYDNAILSLEGKLSSKFEILETKVNGKSEARVKLQDASLRNELLQELIGITDISSFNEEIPSMNDIFIQVVESSKTSSHE